MNNKLLNTLIEHLEGLGTGAIKPRHAASGLCYELADKFHPREVIGLCKERWTQWPGYSGEVLFPVGSGGRQYARYQQVEVGVWGADDYGDARRELCRWLAESLRTSPPLSDLAFLTE